MRSFSDKNQLANSIAQRIVALLTSSTAWGLFCAAWIGRMIARFGERNALVFEYVGLVVIFTAYALVESGAAYVSVMPTAASKPPLQAPSQVTVPP